MRNETTRTNLYCIFLSSIHYMHQINYINSCSTSLFHLIRSIRTYVKCFLKNQIHFDSFNNFQLSFLLTYFSFSFWASLYFTRSSLQITTSFITLRKEYQKLKLLIIVLSLLNLYCTYGGQTQDKKFFQICLLLQNYCETIYRNSSARNI